MTDDPYKKSLSPQQFAVCREGATEPPFSGALLNNKDQGTYHCAACDAALFSSETKYESGSGWPSFWDQISHDAIKEVRDTSHGMIRIEIKCAQCDSHLGHVFPDGPQPTGLRYCTNSLSLSFHPDDT